MSPGPSSATLRRILGAVALFSGAALLVHILAGIGLRLALAVGGAIFVLAIASIWFRASQSQRYKVVGLAKVGFVSGILATASYDLAKFGLSQLDPSPFNPFHALHTFGVLLAGSGAPEYALYLIGTAYHVLNGVFFGVAFSFLLFPRHGIVTGVAWGLFLELFQFALYPDWLQIAWRSEFVQISALGHLVYGAVLGLSCRYGSRRVGLIGGS